MVTTFLEEEVKVVVVEEEDVEAVVVADLSWDQL